jgi:hypothetical protein
MILVSVLFLGGDSLRSTKSIEIRHRRKPLLWSTDR